MIGRVQLIRNVGTFESYAAPAGVDWKRLTLIYGENGVGKTTVTAVLRSLSRHDPAPLGERARLGAPAGAHVVITRTSGGTNVFENGAWVGPRRRVLIYDDTFVDENVCSGLRVLPEHRQNLHGVVLGSEGVELARQVERLAERIADAAHEVREAEEAISDEKRHGLDVETFASLPPRENVLRDIEMLTQRLAEARRAEQIRTQAELPMIAVPIVERAALDALLSRRLEDIDAAALDAVRQHVDRLGSGAEEWIATGVDHAGGLAALPGASCPFCAQPLALSTMVQHFRSFFSERYAQHKRDIHAERERYASMLGEVAQTAAQRATLRLLAARAFWAEFLRFEPMDLSDEMLAQRWRMTRERVDALLATKEGAPLEPVPIDGRSAETLDAFDELRRSTETLNVASEDANRSIREIKDRLGRASVADLENGLNLLRATAERHGDPEVGTACEEYLRRVAAKAQLELDKERAWQALDEHRETVMPRYQEAVNRCLERFGAGFRLARLVSEDRGGRPSSSYALEVRGAPVPLAQRAGVRAPAFATALSSGDRNTLALAFFFGQLELEDDLSDATIVIDDPSSSLDDGRATVTAQQIRSLRARAQQVVVLSHSKRLIAEIWNNGDEHCATLIVRAAGQESALNALDMADHLREEYDRQHAELRGYLAGTFRDPRQVALDLRPVLEGFLRKASNEHFGPGKLIGNFVNECRQAIARGSPILPQVRIDELDQLNEYASRFHHSQDGQRALANLNEGELRGFVTRVLRFASTS